MSQNPETTSSAEERASLYLRKHKDAENVYLDDDSEEGIDEFLLKRAEAELRRAQARVDMLREDMASKARNKSEW